MHRETECELCGASASVTEPFHLPDLPDDHPVKKIRLRPLCNQCGRLYSSPAWFPEAETDFKISPELRGRNAYEHSDEWKSVQIQSTACSFCDSKTLFWLGSAEWANPQAVIKEVENALSESSEGISWSRDATDVATSEWDEISEVTEVLTRSAPVCHECVTSHEPAAVLETIREIKNSQHIQVTQPMWQEKDHTPREQITEFICRRDESE